MTAKPDTVAAALTTEGLDRVDARLLLQHVLGMSHAGLIAHAERGLDAPSRELFLALAARRIAGEPIAYLVGEREFHGRSFRVNAAVLIPRPETELLVDLALERTPRDEPRRILDLGTGSGNIAITLALERPRAAVVAVDANPEALRVARSNAQRLHATNVGFVAGNWFEPLAEVPYHLIVSNPPYVAASDPHLQQGDLRFEPRNALAAGPEGLDALRRIVAEARDYLLPGAWLLFEHGYDQAEAVAELLRCAGYEERFLARDLAQRPRVSGGQKPPRPTATA